jgi:hypothetical protein
MSEAMAHTPDSLSTPEPLEAAEGSVDDSPSLYGYKGLVKSYRESYSRVYNRPTWAARITVAGKKKEVGSSVCIHTAALKWNKAKIEAGVGGHLNPVRCHSQQPLPSREGWKCRGCWSECLCCCVC